MVPFLPHTESEVRHMLDRIGVREMDDLFTDIPEGVKTTAPVNLPHAHAETEAVRALTRHAAENRPKTLFLGAGQYDHLIPAVVSHLTGRSEFVTAYTPYQPEISQGILQALFEFQSAMAEITGLDVANASLYDGFTAAAEACAVALNAKRKGNVLLVAGGVHPYTKSILRTYFGDLDVSIRELPASSGRTTIESLKEHLHDAVAGVLVQTPNITGALEDLTGWADAIHNVGARLIVSAHPLSLGALASPGEWGADIAVGDNQPLGLPPYFGGPSAGYITCTRDLMRRMPGRIVGETIDADGKRAFVLTLQAREQHIKRERATSNICTNQSLAALANLVYVTALGPRGFESVARRNIRYAAYLRERLISETPLVDAVPGPVFNEFTLRVPVERKRWLAAFDKADIAPGIFLADLDPGFSDDWFTLAVTEARSREEMDRYVEIAREACS